MQTKYGASRNEVQHFTTKQLRDEFLITNLFTKDQIQMTYLHYDRMMIGSAVPTNQPLKLEISNEIGVQFFLERRELGIINIGGLGTVEHDEATTSLAKNDGLYLPVGNKKIIFHSLQPNDPAQFYLVSTLGLIPYRAVKINIESANPLHLGSDAESNKRTIYKYFDLQTCQTNSLLMGMTILADRNIWNTMPPHLHDRRSEVYLYFNIDPNEAVFHLMGEPKETRHLVMHNKQAVVSPYWSIHGGVGTKNYTFIWAMGGENISYADVVHVPKKDLL